MESGPSSTSLSFTVLTEGFTSAEVDDASYNKFIEFQKDVSRIADFEASRISKIHGDITDEEQNRDRLLLARQTEQARRNQYLLLTAVFVFICLVAFLFTYIQRVLKIESVIFDILLVVLICIFLIIAFFVYIDIQNRDLNDFSKLRPNASSLLSVDAPNGTSYGVENGQAQTDLAKTCKGAECCGSGFTYDDSTKKCEVSAS